MLEKDDDANEERIRRKKDKKIAKHFTILLNGEKYRIVSYQIKNENINDRAGKLIQLISKFDIMIVERKNVKLEIQNSDKNLEILGDWAYGWWSAGKYCNAYWINELYEK